MKKYGGFVIFPCGFDIWAVVIKYADQRINLNAGGINLYGVTIKTVHTAAKAFKIVREYERMMGRTL